MNRKYRCVSCSFEWEGYRVLKDLDTGKVRRFQDPPMRGGMTECPKCLNLYVEWMNALEILGKLGKYWER
jgi:hypothetical protein